MHLSPRVTKRASASFELVHYDIWGPCPLLSPTGFKYFITFVDDIVITRSDSEGISSLKSFLHSQFHTNDLGMLRYFLGIEVM